MELERKVEEIAGERDAAREEIDRLRRDDGWYTPAEMAQAIKERNQAREENTELREALRLHAVALSTSRRVITAWASPRDGMGGNIVQEDRGRSALALREIAKAEEAWGDVEPRS